jgi:hypothetical protein
MSDPGKFPQKRAASRFRLAAFLAGLAGLAVLNLFLRPSHPHFGLDALPLFWPLFGLGVGLVMVLAVKKIIQPLIVRKEDYYDDL